MRFFLCKYFADVAIGAPQEDELRGAIYIYNGRKSGISAAYSQVRSQLGLVLGTLGPLEGDGGRHLRSQPFSSQSSDDCPVVLTTGKTS